MSENRKDRLTLIFIALLISLGGTLVLWVSRSEEILWSIDSPDDLARTSGEIVHSEVEFSGGRNARGWHYIIVYEFMVDNSTYTSTRVNYSYEGSSDKSFAVGYLQKYPAGMDVTVYFDPADPRMSVLDPEIKDYDWIYILASLYALALFLIYITRYIP